MFDDKILSISVLKSKLSINFSEKVNKKFRFLTFRFLLNKMPNSKLLNLIVFIDKISFPKFKYLTLFLQLLIFS